MYNKLFDFLDKMRVDFSEDPGNDDSINWPAVVLSAANKGKEKLSKYYSKTDKERGFIFNCATILDPSQKLTLYEVFFYYSNLSQQCSNLAHRRIPRISVTSTSTANSL
jgi:hypothetical protein